MKKLLVLLSLSLFTLFAVPARAEDPACWPAPAANGSEPYVSMNGNGFAVLWYCKTGDRWTSSANFYGHWSELPGDWLYQARDLLYGTDAQRLAKLKEAEASSLPDSVYATTVMPLLVQLHSRHDAKYPMAPPLRYVVQRESATVVGSRPVYRLRADGTRNTTAVSGRRVAGLTPCLTRRIGITNYFSVQGQVFTDGSVITEDVYAVCVQVQ